MIPTSEHIEEAERLLPSKGCSCNQGRLERLGYHDEWCPAHYRPTLAQALASRDEKHVTELAVRDARIAALEAALKHCIRHVDEYANCADEIELGAYGACRDVSQIARTALKQDGPAS